MSLGVSARIKLPKKHHELAKSHSQTQLLANRLRQDGVPTIVESVLQGVEQVAAVLAQPHLDPKLCYEDSIINLCQHLKIYGSYLDMLFEDQLNRAFVIFRNSSQDERLGNLSRLHLLQLIELRAKRWKVSDQMNHYYRKKIEASESTTSMTESLVNMSTASTSPPLLNPGELIKTSGKFNKPTRIPGKNYCKDEVVIRNADSGKVMGIKGRRVHMIEELSETIISFQRVNPGAKERLVQITGANEESINHSKQLIEDTIRRNASPVREPAMAGPPLTGSTSSINSSASEESFLPTMRTPRALLHSLSTNDANIGEYKYSVVTNGHTIKISGDNLDLIRTSKLVLDEYFSGEPFYNFESFDNMLVTPTEIKPASLLNNGPKEVSIPDDSFVPLRRPKKSLDEIMNGNTSSTRSSSKKSNSRNNSLSTEKRIVYSLEDLARLAMSPLGLIPPVDWERIYTDYPAIVRKVAERFDLNQYLFDRTGDMNTLVSADEDAELQ